MQKLLTISLLLLSGCTSLGLTEQKTVNTKNLTQDSSLSMASIPTQLRGAYVRSKNSSYSVCAEPFSDVAASNSAKATLEATNKLNSLIDTQTGTTRADGASRTANAKSDQQLEQIAKGTSKYINTIVALDGRTQYVLLAREMMFRTCEAAANGWFSDDKIAAKVNSEHVAVIEALTQMVIAEQQKAKAQSNAAIAEVAKEVAGNKKLDPAILKNMAPGNSSIKSSLYDDMTNCLASAKSRSEQEKCATNYANQINNLN